MKYTKMITQTLMSFYFIDNDYIQCYNKSIKMLIIVLYN